MKLTLFILISFFISQACSGPEKEAPAKKQSYDDVDIDQGVDEEELFGDESEELDDDESEGEEGDDEFDDEDYEDEDSEDDEFDDEQEQIEKSENVKAKPRKAAPEKKKPEVEVEQAPVRDTPYKNEVIIKNKVVKRNRYKASIHGLIRSARVGTPEMCRYHLSRGININGQNRAGETALHAALKAKRYFMAKFLLRQNAKVDIRDVTGVTARGLIMESGNEELIKLLKYR